MNTKREWLTPELVVIGNARPEEAVLLVCKAIGTQLALEPQALGQTGCDELVTTNCGACQDRGGSGS